MAVYLTEEQVDQITKAAREGVKKLKSMSVEELLERISELEIKQFDKEVDVNVIVKKTNESK